MHKHYQVNKMVYLHFDIVFTIWPQIYCIGAAPSTRFSIGLGRLLVLMYSSHKLPRASKLR